LPASLKEKLVRYFCKALVLAGVYLLIVSCGNDDQGLTSATTEDAPYAVGSSTFFIHDESRPYDSVNNINEGIRTLITEVWYPVSKEVANSGKYQRATYGDYVFGDRDVHRLMLTKTTFFHLTPKSVRKGVTTQQIDEAIEELFERERRSFIDAPLADTGNLLPVVVMSHGDAGSRYNMATVVEHLAANGYFVIAPEHTGNSPYSLTGHDPAFKNNKDFLERMADVLPHLSKLGAYGKEEHYGQSYTPLSGDRGSLDSLRNLDQSLVQRLNDLRATLQTLDQINADGFAGMPSGSLNLDRIGLTGRSFGGTTTMVGLAMEPRFTSGFAVVPPGWTDPRPTVPSEALVVRPQESVLLAATGEFPLTTITKPTFLLSGSEDALLIGLAASMANEFRTDEPSADNPHPILRNAYEKNNSPIVWGLLSDSNHATFGVSGGYWWPELKPNVQTRYFEPDITFKLVDVDIAHQLQKELALAFFDFTIRLDESANKILINNQYKDYGLILESKNL